MKILSIDPREYDASFGSMYIFEPFNGNVRVKTPFEYPDGTQIEVYIKDEDEKGFTVTDFGETLRWISTLTTLNVTEYFDKKIDQILVSTEEPGYQRNGYEIFLDTRWVKGDMPDVLFSLLVVDAITGMAQMCIRLSCLRYLLR